MQTVPLVRLVCDALLLGIVWLPIPIFYYSVTPTSRGFFCNDLSIRLPEKEGLISATALYSTGCLLPTVTIAFIESYRTFLLEPRVFRAGERMKSNYQLLGRPIPPLLTSLYVYLGYFYFGMAFNVFTTDLGKYSIGRLRPNFISICDPHPNVKNCSDSDPYEYFPSVVCNGAKSKVRAARLSFPSGHASFSAYTMTYLTLYLHARLIWPMGGFLLKHTLQFAAMTLAIWTGMTRVADHKHHWSDVVAGFILGVVVAVGTAYGMVGMFRRPQNVFARPSPYDSTHYTGGQLSADFYEDSNLQEKIGMEERKKEAT